MQSHNFPCSEVFARAQLEDNHRIEGLTMGIENNAIYRQFQIAEKILAGTFEFRSPIGVVFTGPPGFGKSHLVRALCKRYRQRWQPIRSSASQLMQILSDRRDGLL